MDDAILPAEEIARIQVLSRRNFDSLDFAIMIATAIQSAISHFSSFVLLIIKKYFHSPLAAVRPCVIGN